MKYVTVLPLIAFIVLLPEVASAQLVPCGGPGQDPCEFCHLVQLGNRVVQWLVVVLTIVAGLIFAVAGLKLTTSGGNPAAKDAAKSMFTNVVVGYLIVLSAWLVVDTIMRALVDEATIGPWNQIECVGQPELQQGAPGSGSQIFSIGAPRPGSSGGGFNPDTLPTHGACNPDIVGAYFNEVDVDPARCIIRGESACGDSPISNIDITSDGRPFSFGPMQVNITVHTLDCGGEFLNCPDAFNGTNFNATVRDEELYQRCIDAALDWGCNLSKGAELRYNRGNWGDWRYVGQSCGLSV